jgi:hypothetical protein
MTDAMKKIGDATDRLVDRLKVVFDDTEASAKDDRRNEEDNHVFGGICRTQIDDPIVKTVSILMIKVKWRPIAMGLGPDNMMH